MKSNGLGFKVGGACRYTPSTLRKVPQKAQPESSLGRRPPGRSSSAFGIARQQTLEPLRFTRAAPGIPSRTDATGRNWFRSARRDGTDRPHQSIVVQTPQRCRSYASSCDRGARGSFNPLWNDRARASTNDAIRLLALSCFCRQTTLRGTPQRSANERRRKNQGEVAEPAHRISTLAASNCSTAAIDAAS